MSFKIKIQPWLEPLMDFLWKDKSRVIKNIDQEIVDWSEVIPKEIMTEILEEELAPNVLNLLDENVVDLLQTSRTKTMFAKRLINILTNGVIFVK